ncbi:MAG: type III pantothenate kinase [Bacteroidales bacterium]|nr:type III pantothenate kinase [Bacteroidales bacterium]
MMRIVLDFGNTLHKAGIFDGEKLILLEKYTRLNRPKLKELLAAFPSIKSGIASSVVHYPTGTKKFLQNHLEFFIELSGRTSLPLINKYKTPATLGRDRIACAVAASRLFPEVPALVINAGTCITYDLVTAQKEYLGGAISPGLQMRLKAMHTFTRKLPLIELQDAGNLVGSNTRESMISGAVHGTAAEVKGVIGEYKKHYPGLQVILSGGDMEYLDKLLKIRIFALPNIVMVGLNYILEYNLQYAK